MKKLFTIYVLDQQIIKPGIFNFELSLKFYIFEYGFYMILTLN